MNYDEEYDGITAPELETQFTIGDSAIYVVEVEEQADQFGGHGNGRTRVMGHDNEGHEVEIFFYPAKTMDEDEPTTADRMSIHNMLR